MNRSRLRWIIAIMIGSGLLIYVIKTKLHWDLIEGFSASDHLPALAAIEGKVSSRPEIGEVFTDDFESPLWTRRQWSNLWSQNPDNVSAGAMESDDESTFSTRLQIINRGPLDWSYSHFFRYATQPGDTFRLEFSAASDAKGFVQANIAAYQDKDTASVWNYRVTLIESPVVWQRHVLEFTVGEDAPLIRLQLSGRGRGQSWFDDVSLHRLR